MNEKRDRRTIKKWVEVFFGHERIAMKPDDHVLYGDCFKEADISMGTMVKKEICPACDAGVPKKEYAIIKARDEVPEGKALIISSDFRLINISLVEEPIDKNAVIKTVVRPKSGAKCSKCRQDYPYAENKAEFVCWACRNGY
ncbi:MAG: hypothetical protein ACXADB_07825 [Candidatus Hermodarchaeia archaeon]|jgi:hypothetical protein